MSDTKNKLKNWYFTQTCWVRLALWTTLMDSSRTKNTTDIAEGSSPSMLLSYTPMVVRCGFFPSNNGFLGFCRCAIYIYIHIYIYLYMVWYQWGKGQFSVNSCNPSSQTLRGTTRLEQGSAPPMGCSHDAIHQAACNKDQESKNIFVCGFLSLSIMVWWWWHGVWWFSLIQRSFSENGWPPNPSPP